MDCLLDIGGLCLRLNGAPWAPDAIPRNFRPFVVSGAAPQAPCAVLDIRHVPALPPEPASEALSVSYNDLGKAALHDTGDTWCIALTPCPGQAPRLMEIDKSFRTATVWLLDADPYADFVIDSSTRIFFAQFAALNRGLIVHASTVGRGGLAYLFMGASGTGKSTHSRLWTDTFPGCELLNDDCPLITADSRGILVHGTPWSGKTPCWRRVTLPLGSVARLRQAPENRFIPLSGIEAFVAFIPGMSVMTSDPALYSAASSTALDILAAVPAGILECLPDADAARLCLHSLVKVKGEEGER